MWKERLAHDFLNISTFNEWFLRKMVSIIELVVKKKKKKH